MAISIHALQPALRLPAWRRASQKESSTNQARDRAVPSLGSVGRVFLQLGAVSFGGKSTNSYLFQELVRRRGWVADDDFTETYALAKLLPGGTGPNLVVAVGQLLRGPMSGMLCLGSFTLPGALMMLAATILLFGTPLPGWALNGMNGGAAAALGLLLASSLQMAGPARKARLWLPFATAAFLGSTIFQVNFVVLLLGLGAVSVLANRGQKVVTK